MARKKKHIITEAISENKASEAFARFADADAKIRKIEAENDVKMTKIREASAAKVSEAEAQMEEAFALLEAYAEQHPENFVKAKSMKFAHGTLGYRTGTPKLKTLPKYTFAACTQLACDYLPDYVKVEPTLEKDRILLDRDLPIIAENLKKVGLQVVQDESFYVKTKTEELAA